MAVSNIAGAVPVADVAYGQVGTSEKGITEVVAGSADTEAAVRSYFSDIPVLVQVARCESQFRQTLADGTVLHGKVDPADTGVMQINARYHAKKAAELGLDLNTLSGNLAYARYLYETKGTAPWKASSACWSPTIAMR